MSKNRSRTVSRRKTSANRAIKATSTRTRIIRAISRTASRRRLVHELGEGADRWAVVERIRLHRIGAQLPQREDGPRAADGVFIDRPQLTAGFAQGRKNGQADRLQDIAPDH